MPTSLRAIGAAIDNNDAQGLADILNRFPSDPDEPNEGASIITKHHGEAFIKSRHWPEGVWNGDDSYAMRRDINLRTKVDSSSVVQSSASFAYSLVSRTPDVVFTVPQISKHPVWKHFRTLSSEGKNSILHVLTRQTQKAKWIDRLLTEVGQWIREKNPQTIEACWRGCLQWSTPRAAEGLEVFRRHGWLDLNNPQHLNAIISEAAQRGRLSVIEWAQDITGCPRIDGVEAKLMRHRRLNGPGQPTSLQQAVRSLSQRWGPAPDKVVVDVWKSLVKYHLFKRTGPGKDALCVLEMIEEQMDCRELWDEANQRHLLRCATNSFGLDGLRLYRERGWVFSDTSLDESIQHLEGYKETAQQAGDSRKVLEMISFLKRERLLLSAGTTQTTQAKPKPLF